jgi:hypothetical protein
LSVDISKGTCIGCPAEEFVQAQKELLEAGGFGAPKGCWLSLTAHPGNIFGENDRTSQYCRILGKVYPSCSYKDCDTVAML